MLRIGTYIKNMKKNEKYNHKPKRFKMNIKTPKKEFKTRKKSDVDKGSVLKGFEETLIMEEAEDHFSGALFQKDVSDHNFLPERALFSLPVKFVNSILNYGAKEKVAPYLALETLLTKAFDALEMLRFIPQRDENSDNQSRRLHNVVTWMSSGSEEKAREIIEENKDRLNEMVQEAIALGKVFKKGKKAA